LKLKKTSGRLTQKESITRENKIINYINIKIFIFFIIGLLSIDYFFLGNNNFYITKPILKNIRNTIDPRFRSLKGIEQKYRNESEEKLKSEYLNTSFSEKKLINFFSLNELLFIFREIFIDKNYKFNSKKKCPFIIDCGANIGLATLYFKSLYPNSHILAFEPSEKNFKALSTNVAANNLKNVTTIKKALYNSIKQIQLCSPGSIASTIMFGSGIETCHTDLLSSYIDTEVDLLKIDVEGAETSVLKDLSQNNKLNLVKEIIIEYHHSVGMKENNFYTIISLLDSHNFKYKFSISKEDLETKLKSKISCNFMIHAEKESPESK